MTRTEHTATTLTLDTPLTTGHIDMLHTHAGELAAELDRRVRNNNMVRLQGLLEEANRLHTLSLDETLEEEVTDEYYAEYWAVAEHATSILMEIIGGFIDRKTASRMVHHRRNDIMALLARLA